MARIQIQQLGIHVSHTCNLSCKYCAHYCNYGYKGILDLNTGIQWLKTWAPKVFPKTLRFYGGEPLLNRELPNFLRIGAELYPDSVRQVYTNGLLMRTIEDWIPVFVETDTALIMSLNPLENIEQEKVVNDALVVGYKWRQKGLKFKAMSKAATVWKVTYRGEGSAITPFNDKNPQKSWENCWCKHCHVLEDNKIWLCPLLAFLPKIVDQLETKEEWYPYLKYQPLTSEATDEEILKMESYYSPFCAMCPSEKWPKAKAEGVIPISPLRELTLKYRNLQKQNKILKEKNKVLVEKYQVMTENEESNLYQSTSTKVQ